MAHYRARVQIFDLVEADASRARRAIEQRLQRAGFTGWQFISLGCEDAGVDVGPAIGFPHRPQRDQRGAAFVAAAAGIWALWILWLLFE